MWSAVSLFTSSVGRLMRGTVLSQAFSDRLQSPRTGGLVSVCLWSSHEAASHLRSHCDSSLERPECDQNFMLQLSKHLSPILFNPVDVIRYDTVDKSLFRQFEDFTQ